MSPAAGWLTLRFESNESPKLVATDKRPSLPSPSLSTQFTAAAAGRLLLAPTPTAVSSDCTTGCLRPAQDVDEPVWHHAGIMQALASTAALRVHADVHWHRMSGQLACMQTGRVTCVLKLCSTALHRRWQLRHCVYAQ